MKLDLRHKIPGIFILLVLIVFLIANSFFSVQEGQKGLVLILGKLKARQANVATVYPPGLHMKLPWISVVKKFDTRIQGFSSGEFSVLTAKQTALVVEYYVKWRISNVALYYQRTGGIAKKTEILMEQKINDELRAQFGRRKSGDAISTARTEIMQAILTSTQRALSEDYGVEILDVQLSAIKLPPSVLTSVFKRMAAERTQFANNKRAEGMKVAESIRAEADQRVVVIKAQALQEAAQLKAQGDEKAATIYAKTYDKDRKFYNFYRSLLAYRASFKGKEDILVLAPQGQFFNYFQNAGDNQK